MPVFAITGDERVKVIRHETVRRNFKGELVAGFKENLLNQPDIVHSPEMTSSIKRADRHKYDLAARPRLVCEPKRVTHRNLLSKDCARLATDAECRPEGRLRHERVYRVADLRPRSAVQCCTTTIDAGVVLRS